jgi:hypothetical protein
MSAFEFLFSFYGLLFGLTLVEVVSGFRGRLMRARNVRSGSSAALNGRRRANL